ncbi:MAG: GntR family transcriptional regulator [Chitinivibrionales bacterium]|nr:GntR family transcriptional regulator [Chitinivibrionales bacterium]
MVTVDFPITAATAILKDRYGERCTMAPAQKRPTRVKAAADHVRTCAAAATGLSPRLPSIRRMAAQAGVPVSTMGRAVRLLAAEGVVQIVGRGGILATRIARLQGLPARMQRAPDTAVERVRRHLSDEILRGAYRPGDSLPPYKELCRDIGACYTTVRRALQLLRSQGRVVRRGRRFALPCAMASPDKGEIVFISPTDWVDSMVQGPSRGAAVWSSLKQACNRRRVGVRTYGYYVTVREEVGPRYRDALEQFLSARRDRVLGCLISGVGDFDDYLMPSVLTALGHGLPVAVVDETGRQPNLRQLRRLPNAHLLRWYPASGNVAAGADVANALIALGHRRMALFTLVPGHDWCDLRTQAFCRACADAGLRDSPQLAFIDEQRIESSMRSDPQLLGCREQVRELMKRIEAFGPAWYGRGKAALNTVGDSLRRRATAHACESLFERMHAHHDATVWVGVTDEIALDAHEYLRSRGIAVPSGVSIVGFDDSLEAFGHGLASYNFNVPAIVDAVVDQLTGHRVTSRSRAEVVAVPGELSSRATLAKPRHDR